MKYACGTVKSQHARAVAPVFLFIALIHQPALLGCSHQSSPWPPTPFTAVYLLPRSLAFDGTLDSSRPAK